MKTRLLILFTFLAFGVNAQIQNFNMPVKFNVANEADEEDSIQILVRTNPQETDASKNITKWISATALNPDLSDYFTKEETSQVISDSLATHFNTWQETIDEQLNGGSTMAVELPSGGMEFSDTSWEIYGYVGSNLSFGTSDTGRFYINSAEGNFTFEDPRTEHKGIEYNFTDYEDLTNNSLVPKKYVDDAISDSISVALSDYIPISQKGANNGVATLDAGGDVPVSQIDLSINDLNDTPANFTGAGGLIVAVNSAATAVEYRALVPPDLGMTSGAGNVLYRVNATTFGSYVVDQTSAGNNTLVRRTSAGEIFTSPPTNGGHAVNLTYANATYQPLDSDLSAIAGSTLTGDGKLTRSGVSWSMDNTDYATDSEVVKLTGNQTIADIKTFSSSPIVPTPTTGTQTANKDYVDNAILNRKWTATFTGDVTFAVSGSQILNANLSDVPDATEWNNATNFEITWKDSGFLYKISSLEDVLEAIPSYGSGNLSLSLVVTSSVTIPTGAKIIFTND